MKKLFLLSCLIGSVGIINAQSDDDTSASDDNASQTTVETVTYAIKKNDETKKNEIYLVNDDGTSTLLVEFEFPSGEWDPANSYVNTKDGKLYLYDSGNNICVSGDCDGPGVRVFEPLSDELKGFVVYDPATNSITRGVKAGYSNGYEATFNGVYALDDLISEEENGEIHIGENSLVTVEKDGVQLLYATDVNGDQIDINIKKGTDLLVDGKSVTQALKDIDANETNIAKNADDIATNKTNIATNATNIATNTTNIATNRSNIETNALGIANNSLRIDNIAALVNSNVNRIEGLETLTGLMRDEYRTGIASSIALSQIQYASDGFSFGVGHGEFKDKDEMAVGIGYGGQFNEKVGYQFQLGSSGDSTGFGFTISF